MKFMFWKKRKNEPEVTNRFAHCTVERQLDLLREDVNLLKTESFSLRLIAEQLLTEHYKGKTARTIDNGTLIKFTINDAIVRSGRVLIRDEKGAERLVFNCEIK